MRTIPLTGHVLPWLSVLALILLFSCWWSPALALGDSLAVEPVKPEAAALYNLGAMQGARGNWQGARCSYGAAARIQPDLILARSSQALAAMELGELAVAEETFRRLIRRHPLFADARAGLTALLWRRGRQGEAESHWAASVGLDERYTDAQWLLTMRQWPPGPVQDLRQFLASGTS
ncbi:MAG: tetratricopeptide repeat protein [Synechococcus sp. SB0666_bin_14]|nr:tetratricopeptide repeat protein [Synechococcus sp. SB0666_bin_14]MYA91050.1 tetratricopeptide repeat protein [Synechococcus sp. SB0663_bin_10]MYG46615.1 tetratricopeptide repeat protein [Synechococcus sp. SB0675_bin_6]MYJ60285.1 tetratricopeptide repeat protein [Synechococcus sp. SB0672_bin_6]MYK90837.1 tetratricopeptide repeat protein [Synechococcus sp. SB0669_bin_8]